jgi:hypothetical protein
MNELADVPHHSNHEEYDEKMHEEMEAAILLMSITTTPSVDQSKPELANL